MSDYTPTTDELATLWRDSRCYGDHAGDRCPAVEEFDRWLASVRAAALDEAAEVVARKVTPLMYFGSDGEFFASAIRALKEEKK